MQLLSLISLALAAATAHASAIEIPKGPSNTPPTKAPKAPSHPQGIDVSEHQTNVNWPVVKSTGVEFAYIKATEGIKFKNPEFSKQYTGATNAGLLRGSTHFARPDASTGAAQAEYFVAHGGKWSADGHTLPGVIHFEGTCPHLSPPALVSWIQDFSTTYHLHTGRDPVIYTATGWWETCTGSSAAFAKKNPLWIARLPGSSNGTGTPPGWVSSTFVQDPKKGSNPWDEHTFNGDSADLKKFASGPGH